MQLYNFLVAGHNSRPQTPSGQCKPMEPWNKNQLFVPSFAGRDTSGDPGTISGRSVNHQLEEDYLQLLSLCRNGVICDIETQAFRHINR